MTREPPPRYQARLGEPLDIRFGLPIQPQKSLGSERDNIRYRSARTLMKKMYKLHFGERLCVS
jgi:hypothetical protein